MENLDVNVKNWKSLIKPAKLEFTDIDEDHRGWTVVVNE